MNQTAWDLLITGGVIGAMILAFWAKSSGQTIPELLRGIKEFLQDTGEESVEAVYYE